MVEALFSPTFQENIRTHSSIKKAAEKKVLSLIQHPMNRGEPLKKSLRGLFSVPVRKNFILIYVYCRECRLRGYTEDNACSDCEQTPDDVIKFLTIGPHDDAYALATEIRSDLPANPY